MGMIINEAGNRFKFVSDLDIRETIVPPIESETPHQAGFFISSRCAAAKLTDPVIRIN
jgi:hypothetical protein